MATTITATEANQRFSEMLRKVEHGETFVVTSRGRPVARLVPAHGEQDERAARRRAFESLLAEVEALPPRTLPGWRREDLYD